jgi:predicted alpha/beta hydrolase family esterase
MPIVKQVILIHGNGDSHGEMEWFPAVRRDLQAAGIATISPDFPEAEIAPMNKWLPFLEKLGADEQTILIGFSSGAIAAMRYAEIHRIAGSVLVGTYYTDLNAESERLSGYFDTPWDWQAIKRNQEWISIFASVDDPYIDIAEPRFIRDQLHAEYFEFTDRGHFMDGDGCEFPELVAHVIDHVRQSER